MQLFSRYRISLIVLFVAFASAAGIFMFALPRYQRPQQIVVDLSRAHYFSPALVRRTFAAQGIDLRYSNHDPRALFLSNQPMPLPVESLYVIVMPAKGSAAWLKDTPGYWEKPVGNLLIHYGGANRHTLAAVRAAFAELHAA